MPWAALIGAIIVGLIALQAYRFFNRRWVDQTAAAARARLDLKAGYVERVNIEIGEDHLVSGEDGFQVLVTPIGAERTAFIALDSEFEDDVSDEIRRGIQFSILPASRSIVDVEFSGNSIVPKLTPLSGRLFEDELCLAPDQTSVVLDMAFERARHLLTAPSECANSTSRWSHGRTTEGYVRHQPKISSGSILRAP